MSDNEQRLKRLMTELYNCGFDVGCVLSEEPGRPSELIELDIVALLRGLESTNEALVKRVAELEAESQQLKHACDRAMSDFHTLKAYNEENEGQLRKRVAELEQKAYDLEMALGPYSAGALSSDLSDKLRDIAYSQDNEFWDETFRSAAARIEFLQSQLAWTPVGKGLPTEHADYEFTYCDSEQVSRLDLIALTHVGFTLALSGDNFESEELLDNVDYTHYRRIELPGAK